MVKRSYLKPKIRAFVVQHEYVIATSPGKIGGFTDETAEEDEETCSKKRFGSYETFEEDFSAGITGVFGGSNGAE